MKTVLFHRRLRGLTGGHLKVWDFFRHTLASGDHTAKIVFTADSVWTAENPWRDAKEHVVASFASVKPDLYFFGAFDWEQLPAAERRSSKIPVLNLIAHVRHGDPKDPRFPMLANRAIRICVSPEVRTAITAHTQPNGPIVVIPNAVDVTAAPRAPERDVDLVVVALKQPLIGARLAERLTKPGRRVQLLDKRLPRTEFLGWLSQSKTALCLPHETEGFYLPALEAMALGTLVVCPDAIGNREFCEHGVNCLFPEFSSGAIQAAAEEALALPPERRATMVAAGRETAARHGLEDERRAFVELLREAPRLWRA